MATPDKWEQPKEEEEEINKSQSFLHMEILMVTIVERVATGKETVIAIVVSRNSRLQLTQKIANSE